MPPTFSLLRAYAYTVTPQKGVEEDAFIPPAGGGVKISPALEQVIKDSLAKVHKGTLTAVDFENDADRQHEVREDLMLIAFGQTKAPKTAAARVAARLSAVMDHRSQPALLLFVIEAAEAKRRVSMLLLPREDVVKLNSEPTEEVLLELLEDVFSTGSDLRKFAKVEGHNGRTQFLFAEILDLQLTVPNKNSADFWVKDFLQARLRMNSDSGSRILVAALRRAFDAAPVNERDATFAAMHKAGSGLVKKTSLVKYAEELPEELHEPFFRGIEEEVQRTAFEVNPELIKESLGRRIIETKDGVIISAPAEAVGDSVKIETDGERRSVKVTGVIEKERLDRRGRGSKTKANKAPSRMKN